MRGSFLLIFFLIFFQPARSQTKPTLLSVLVQVSKQWREDSTSCKGYRKLLVNNILTSQIDNATKEQIFNELGKPNRTQRFYSGVTNRNYIAFIYDVYKDACPKTEVEGYAIQFVFDEAEIELIEISGIDYCG